MSEPFKVWLNGKSNRYPEPHNRGLAYGDGLFETMRVCSGSIKLLDYHLSRLKRGAECLKFDLDALDSKVSESVAIALSDSPQDCVLKLIVYREEGGRGYMPGGSGVNVLCQLFSLPDYSELRLRGLRVKRSTLSLSSQPVLAGIKHLNRLEQVLAAQEIGQADDVLLSDCNGNVIESSKANVLVFDGEAFVTPKLDECGIRGTALSYLFDHQSRFDMSLSETTIKYESLDSVESMFMINSVMGMVRVSQLDNRSMTNTKDLDVLAKAFNKELFA